MPLFVAWSLAAAFLLLFHPAARASPCFDFEKKIVSPLHASIRPGSRRDASASGHAASGAVWGAARGTVNLPLSRIYAKLLDPYVIKDRSKVELRIYDQDRAGYQDFHVVMVELHATSFLTVNWEEEWGFAIAQGTSMDPVEAVISYQKTNGTAAIRRLCGSIVLTRLTPGSTDVYLYEEIDALGRRTPEETAKSHLGTLKTLRSPPPPERTRSDHLNQSR